MTPAGRFAVATALLGVSAVGAVALIHRSTRRGRGRLSGVVKTEATFTRRLAAIERDYAKLATTDDDARVAAIVDIRKRLRALEGDAAGRVDNAEGRIADAFGRLEAARQTTVEDRRQQLEREYQRIRGRPSPVYETAPWGTDTEYAAARARRRRRG